MGIETLKETIKERLPFLYAIYARWKLRQTRRQLVGASMEDRFSRIYRDGLWTQDEPASSGSYLLERGRLDQHLPALLAELGVQTMLDIPCGDYHWMSQIKLGVQRYIGADVVQELIDDNRQRVGEVAGVEFLRLDLVADPLPRADLLFCRDCLVHFSFAHIELALANMAASGATWLMTTTFPDRKGNIDIATGEWRPLNMERPPFRFPPPFRLLNEACPDDNGRYHDKSLGVWRLADLPLPSPHAT